MSSILKALRRVESELAERAVRDLHEEVLSSARPTAASAPARRSTLRGVGVIVAMLALLALGAALGRWLGGARPSATPDDVARAAAPAAARPTPPAPAPPAARPTPPAPAPPADAVVAVVAPPPPPPTPSFVDIDDDAPPGGALPEAEPLEAPSPARGNIRPDLPLAPAPAPPRTRAAPDLAAAPARRPAPRPVAASPALPRVASTVWHPDSMRRRAVVDVGRTSRDVREGETVGGYLVLAIGPSGVVFRRDGADITRRVGQR